MTTVRNIFDLATARTDIESATISRVTPFKQTVYVV
jgi:hypothetical protein